MLVGNCPLVLIEWDDSRQPEPGWERQQGFQPRPVCRCASVGWLIYDGLDKEMLAPNMADIESEQNIQASGIIQIPSSCVTRVVRVEEVAVG